LIGVFSIYLTLSATKRQYEKECDITPLKGPPVVSGSTLTPLILASIFFVARIFAKSCGLAGGWGWDDYTIIVSYVSRAYLVSFLVY
jgi:hypothetical protein